MPRRSRVFTIPSSVPFLPTLASAMLDGTLIENFSARSDPMALAAATVFLPTRRAARAFEYAILDALGTDAALLPRIVPLGDLDEDALAFSEDQPAEDILPAVSATERRLALASLVAKFSEFGAIASSPASAIKLADELARLFDDLTTAGVKIEDLKKADLVPLNLDEFWQKSLQFIQLAYEGWRNHLKGIGKEDPAVRRDLLLARKADDLRKRKGGPFIAAGSTGTIPAVANLLVAISEREDGAVVLPGLDDRLDEPSFKLIQGMESDTARIDASYGHPQFGLSRLLSRLKIARSDVVRLGEETNPEKTLFSSEAFRPSATTDLWSSRKQRLSDADASRAIKTFTLIEATDPREEALAAAIVLRESLEIEGTRSAFVTHDRSLARRVAAELRRWNVAVDDSAGIPLAESEAGRFARLTAAAVAEQLAPVPLLAFLRHPLNKISGSAAIDALELAVLRGPRPAAGANGLIRSIEHSRSQTHHRRDRRAKLEQPQWDEALGLAKKIGDALAPLLQFSGTKSAPCSRLVAAHRESLKRCGLVFSRNRNDGSYELSAAFDAIEQAISPLEFNLDGYASAFAELLRGEPPVRRDFDPDDRIRILGPLEARLLQADQILIGGLNEGVWPPEAHSDAWLNRPLRKQLGLDLPERRIGLAAHDFVQAIGMQNIILSRAKKQNGVETVASRFLQRLAAIAPETAWAEAKSRGEHLLAVSREFENRIKSKPIDRPAPAPPVAARPKQLSVTEIETLIRDPYSIYARHVLALNPLEEADADPGAAERGNLLHEAFAAFANAFPEKLPADAYEKLVQFGREAFKPLQDFPSVHALWWPRFERAAHWFIGTEAARRAGVTKIHSETGARKEFKIGDSAFTLTARADRIDQHSDGSAGIYDYKTGEAPTLKQAVLGLTPQLPLEAALLREGGFRELSKPDKIGEIAVLRISGGNPPGETREFNLRGTKGDTKKLLEKHELATEDDLAVFALNRLLARIKLYADEKAPYQSVPRAKWRGRFGQYDHLARIKEWSANEGGEE